MVYVIDELRKKLGIDSGTLPSKHLITNDEEFKNYVLVKASEENRDFLVDYWKGKIKRDDAMKAKGHKYSYVTKLQDQVIYHWLTNHYSKAYYDQLKKKIYMNVSRVLRPAMSNSRAKSLFRSIDELIVNDKPVFMFNLHAMLYAGFKKNIILLHQSGLSELDDLVTRFIDDGYLRHAPQLPTDKGYVMKRAVVTNYISAAQRLFNVAEVDELDSILDMWQEQGWNYYFALLKSAYEPGYVPFVSVAIAAYITKILISARYQKYFESTTISNYFDNLGINHYRVVTFVEEFVNNEVPGVVMLLKSKHSS